MININEYLINKNTKEKQSIYDVILDAVKQCKERCKWKSSDVIIDIPEEEELKFTDDTKREFLLRSIQYNGYEMTILGWGKRSGYYNFYPFSIKKFTFAAGMFAKIIDYINEYELDDNIILQ